MWFAWAVMVLGWGLMTQLDDTSSTYVHRFFHLIWWGLTVKSRAEKVLYPFVTSLGIGCLFQVHLRPISSRMASL